MWLGILLGSLLGSMHTCVMYLAKRSRNINELLRYLYSKLENNIWYIASKDINRDGCMLGFMKIGQLEHMLWPKHEICTLGAQCAYLAKKSQKIEMTNGSTNTWN